MELKLNPCIYCGNVPEIKLYKATGKIDDNKDFYTCQCEECASADSDFRWKKADACGDTQEDCANAWNEKHPENEVMRQVEYLMLNRNLWHLGKLVAKMRAVVNEFDILISISNAIPSGAVKALSGREQLYLASKSQIESLLKMFVKEAGEILHFDTEIPMEIPVSNPCGAIWKE